MISMASICPFRAYRPASRLTERVAALPYDVYHREEAARAASQDPLSFLNIDRPETQFPPQQDMYAPEVYRKAHDLLQEEIRDGIFVQDDMPCYYLYELTMDGRSQNGLVACASIDDYQNGVIKKHENTREEKEQDRICHVDACSMQTGPIFLAYRSQPLLNQIIRNVKESAPVFNFTSPDGICHRGWVIDSPETIQEISDIFSRIRDIYIADGHHRAASAVKVGLMRRRQYPEYNGTEEFNSFLSVLFPDDELMIMDYNRVVKDLNGLTPEEFISRVMERFDLSVLETGRRPEKKGEFTMCLGGSWYVLRTREDKPDVRSAESSADGCTGKSQMAVNCRVQTGCASENPVEQLDVSILQNLLLDPLLGIHDPKTDSRIDFVGGIHGIRELERRTQDGWAVAFAVYPVQIRELFEVADAGLLMPPKSTWFEPKLRSGLFLHEIESGK